MEWEIYDTLWELFTYLSSSRLPTYLAGMDGCMDGFNGARNQESTKRLFERLRLPKEGIDRLR